MLVVALSNTVSTGVPLEAVGFTVSVELLIVGATPNVYVWFPVSVGDSVTAPTVRVTPPNIVISASELITIVDAFALYVPPPATFVNSVPLVAFSVRVDEFIVPIAPATPLKEALPAVTLQLVPEQLLALVLNVPFVTSSVPPIVISADSGAAKLALLNFKFPAIFTFDPDIEICELFAAPVNVTVELAPVVLPDCVQRVPVVPLTVIVEPLPASVPFVSITYSPALSA